MVAQNSANFPIFRGHARQRGKGFAQTLGRTAIPFIKKYVGPAAKRIRADLFEIAAPEIGEVVIGRKKLKTFAIDALLDNRDTKESFVDFMCELKRKKYRFSRYLLYYFGSNSTSS